jgi:hypothetical protein
VHLLGDEVVEDLGVEVVACAEKGDLVKVADDGGERGIAAERQTVDGGKELRCEGLAEAGLVRRGTEDDGGAAVE